MNKIVRVGQVSNKGSQAGMVYDPNGLFPTICAGTHGYAMGNIIEYYDRGDSKSMNKIIRLGNIYPSGGQNGEIYDARGISPTISSGQGKRGNGIGSNNSPKCLINTKGEMNMWKNELTKFDFLMEEIKIFDVFAGIGALHQSLKDLGVPTKVTSLSEIDIDATISYAAGHIENFKDIEFEYPSDEEMKKWLMDRNIGYSYEKDKSSVPRIKKDKLRLAYKANVLLNNLGDISKINYEEIPDFDLMNFSFSCTDLSNSGKQRGMRNPDGTPTRSGLYIYGIKAIRTKKPKYIMIENVKGLIQKKFIDDFYSIIDELEEIGYNCYYPTKEDKKGNKSPTCLNSKDFGIPQNRERIFVIAIRKDIDIKTFEFPIGKDYGVRLKDVLEEQVDEKYYLSSEIQNKISCEQRSDEGLKFFKDNICGTLRTIDSCGDKRVIENNYRIRKLTPLEAWRLMGFRDEAFYKAQELGVSDSQLYKQAGNSIVVNCLYYIFKNLFKDYII